MSLPSSSSSSGPANENANASVILFTGFPGFLGRELLPRVLGREPELRALCVVQQKFMVQARAAVAELSAATPALTGRIELAIGDITLPDLGLPAGAAARVRDVYHLAAIYDLAVPSALADKVNVGGTRNVLDFAERCPGLRRVHYVSTCYVSGRYTGIFAETDLEKGQRFNNHYESTKHLAEVVVRQRMVAGLPATIYRPAVVVGDSRTGATQKLDGPYYLIKWLLRQGPVALLPFIGDPSRFRFNMVPCDFVVDAITYLSGLPESLGKTYALADPEPPTCEEVLDLMAAAVDKRVLRVPLSPGLARAAIRRVPGVHRLLQLPAELVDYMEHPTHYDSRATHAALAAAGIHPGRFADHVKVMVAFTREHMQVSSAAMA